MSPTKLRYVLVALSSFSEVLMNINLMVNNNNSSDQSSNGTLRANTNEYTLFTMNFSI